MSIATYNSGTVAPFTHQTIASPLPNSSENTTGIGAGYVEYFPIFIPDDVSEISISVGNRSPIIVGGDGYNATSNIAIYPSNGSGAPTGSPFQVFTSQTIPGDGTLLVLPSVPVTRGTDGQVVIVFSVPATIMVVASLYQNPGYGKYVTGTSTVSPLPTFTGDNPNILFQWYFTYPTRKQRILVLGDSISVGVDIAGTGVTFPNSCWYRMGVLKNCAVCVNGLPGGGLSQFSDPVTYPYFWDQVKVNGSDVVIQAGVNDLNAGSTAMEGYLVALINYLRIKGARRIYANTIAPQATYAGTDTTRNTYNAFIRSSQMLDGYCDLALAKNLGGLADNSNPNALDSSFDTGDGIHINIAGNVQALNKWLTVFKNNTTSSFGKAVSQINTTARLTGGPISSFGTLDLAASGVTAGSYTSTNLTVDAYGRITTAANGSGGGISGSIANHQVAYGNGTSITGSSNFSFDGYNAIVSGTDGDGSLVGPMRVVSPSAGTVGAWFTLDNTAQSSGRKWSIGSGGSATPINGAFYVGDNTAGAYRMSIDSSGGLKLHASSVTIGSDGKIKGPTEYWGASTGSGKLIIDDGSNGSKLGYNSNFVSVDSANVNVSAGSLLLSGSTALKVGGNVGFYGTTPIAQQSATGITTVAQLITALQNLGLLGA